MSLPKDELGFTQKASRLLDKARNRPVIRDLDRFERILGDSDRFSRERGLSEISSGQLAEEVSTLRDSLKKGGLTEENLAAGAALVREASSRALGMRHYPVQMAAGVAMAEGNLVEMQTGEGKTIAAVIPAFIHALSGEGVHVMTFNDYLARRDAEWMGPVYGLLGLEVSAVVGGMDPGERRLAYEADVVYTTAREVGYDLLKDSLATGTGEVISRGFGFAVVDEADSILIDEARIPLVIAGGDEGSSSWNHEKLAKDVALLKPSEHFCTDRDSRTVYFTDAGYEVLENELGYEGLADGADQSLWTAFNQALHARALLTKDVDYIVRGGAVEIVDEFTGRVAERRQWPHGLHQAVEAKEGVSCAERGRVLGRVTIQDLMGLYGSVCAMTGTALPSDEEIFDFYGMKTVVIPPNVPCVREDLPDFLFTHKAAKWRAVAKEALARSGAGRPVLIGTTSVEDSEDLAEMIRGGGGSCAVLNAVNDLDEARIVARAGEPGRITVSTNMAGRGTDIVLGGPKGERRDEVVERGGLLVLGTARHESRRVDDQLRGRAGRQGDPGESRFYLSLEDDLMVRFRIDEWVPKAVREDKRETPLENPRLAEKLRVVQRRIEGENFKIRRTLREYSEIVEGQRRMWARMREEILNGEGGFLRERCAEKWIREVERCGEEAVKRAEGDLTLFFMDRSWADHLEEVDSIQEGVHLTRIGGGLPILEYSKAVARSFDEKRGSLEEDVAGAFEAATITPEGVDLEREGLNRPSSTWTYQVDDNPFDFLSSISSMGNIGLGVAAGLWGGLFVIKALWEKLRGTSASRR